MCVLAGCDFLPSVPGIGIGKAYALVSKYQNLDRVSMLYSFLISLTGILCTDTAELQIKEAYFRSIYTFLNHKHPYRTINLICRV